MDNKFKTVDLSGGQSSRPKRANYVRDGQERRVMHFEVSSSELVFGSLFQPIGGGLIGFGVHLWAEAASIPDPALSRKIESIGITLIAGGAVVMLVWFSFVVSVYSQAGMRLLPRFMRRKQ